MWRWRKWLGNRSPATGRHHRSQCRRCSRSPQGANADRRLSQAQHSSRRLCHWPDRFALAKWHRAIFVAFDALLKKDTSAWLILVGLPDELLSDLQALRPEARSRVTLVPLMQSDAELSLAYSAMDCFVHAANIGESFGLVLAEAMLCGCPRRHRQPAA